MSAIYTAVDGLTEAILVQATEEGWSFKSEYDDGTWYVLEKYNSDTDTETEVQVEVSRKGRIEFAGKVNELSNRLTTMFKALAMLLVEFWAQYEIESKA